MTISHTKKATDIRKKHVENSQKLYKKSIKKVLT